MKNNSARLMSPTLEEIALLPDRPTDGELKVLRFFHEHLDHAWEMYFRPHLNGLRPDIVLLNPEVGIAVFEVKDWNLQSLNYSLRTAKDGSIVLHASERGKAGREFAVRDPVEQLKLYKQEIYDLYCPRLAERYGFGAITAGLIFPNALSNDVKALIEPLLKAHFGAGATRNVYPIVSADELSSGRPELVFPAVHLKWSRVMSIEIAEDLRGWLREPSDSRQQRVPLELDARQLQLAQTRTESGFRRVRGPAGAGKTAVIAARAAELATLGKSVLVVTFNITLLNYIRDLAVRHGEARRHVKERVEFLNFHSWCKRVSVVSGNSTQYRRLWADAFARDGEEGAVDPVLQTELAAFIRRLYSMPELAGSLPLYDAILVDEGQDFHPDWWGCLRSALGVGGEMVLAADKTQNIYSVASRWTEVVMSAAGFRGPWAELESSYRLPPAIVPLLRDFIERFMDQSEALIPKPVMPNEQMQFEDLYPVDLRWIQLESQSDAHRQCVLEICNQMKALKSDTAIPDITFLCGKHVGRQVVEELERPPMRLRVLHTYDPESGAARRQKRAFFQGKAKVRATTVHSFKGWESRHLIVFVDRADSLEDKALIYTALSRLQRHIGGSSLTVISACPELKGFGAQWPAFECP